MIIRAKIDVTKVDKERLFPGKNGAKYLDITLLENKNGVDQYKNNGMVIQDVSKEERDQGVRGAILGNFKIVGTNPKPAYQKQAGGGSVKHSAPAEHETDEVPF